VIDALQERGLASGPIGAYGVSYGATTSIHLAAIDPRVRAVVAVEPFSVLRAEVPHFGRALVPGGVFIPDELAQRRLDEAGRLAGFDPDRSDAVDAIRRTRAQVLIAHGTWDYVTPYGQSVLLNRAAPDHSELVTVPHCGHTGLWLDLTGALGDRAVQWFDRWLGSENF
jgi:dipeptidyl aminopeptidase/acylaminoacyl peptidase